MIDPAQDYFTLFGLRRLFRLDLGVLEAAYHELHSVVHPDRHAARPEAERRRAMQEAAFVNEAFVALKQPLERARYLLRLAGESSGEHDNVAMAPAFLMEQMEWREAIDEARQATDSDELTALAQRLRDRERHQFERLASLLDDEHDYPAAAEQVRQLMFMRRLDQDIDDALEALED